VGNAATRRILARDKATKAPDPPAKDASGTAPIFRLLIVDDGKSGLDPDTLAVALDTVRSEMATVTSQSTVDAVKAGFDVHYVSELKPWEPKDLGKRSFIAFLIHDQDAKHWADVAAHHVDLTPDEQKDQEKHIKHDAGQDRDHNSSGASADRPGRACLHMADQAERAGGWRAGPRERSSSARHSCQNATVVWGSAAGRSAPAKATACQGGRGDGVVHGAT
jgi:hypothetical protein